LKGFAIHRHCPNVKALPILFVCALLLVGQTDADRTAIEGIITALNDIQKGQSTKPVSELFTADAENELNRLLLASPQGAPAVWSEVTRPHIVTRSIRYLTADVAVVEVANSQFGSVMMRSIPALLVMKKETAGWRIAALRILAPARLL
jgi:hypothetical protein